MSRVRVITIPEYAQQLRDAGYKVDRIFNHPINMKVYIEGLKTAKAINRHRLIISEILDISLGHIEYGGDWFAF